MDATSTPEDYAKCLRDFRAFLGSRGVGDFEIGSSHSNQFGYHDDAEVKMQIVGDKAAVETVQRLIDQGRVGIHVFYPRGGK